MRIERFEDLEGWLEKKPKKNIMQSYMREYFSVERSKKIGKDKIRIRCIFYGFNRGIF